MKKLIHVILLISLFLALCYNKAHIQQPQSPQSNPTFEKKVSNITPKNQAPKNFFVLNKKNNKYHTQNCKYAQKISDLEYISPDKITKKHIPCSYCIKKSTQKPSWVPKNFDTTVGNISIYFLDFTANLLPSSDCSSKACLSLLQNIEKAERTIDFAIYGIDRQPKIFNALVSARNRGVKIRWVTDLDAKDQNIYKDTPALMKELEDYKTDGLDGVELEGIKAPRSFKNAIMHNKFFIFDSKSVWTGSANISGTDLSGFNANTVIFINSKQIAKIYENEFENLYNNKFHTLKPKTEDNEDLSIQDATLMSVYFSPNDTTISTKLIPLINSAKSYIYMPMFVITHKDACTALINAKKRGVDVKVILDATSASSKISKHKLLQEAGIPVKVENLAGKMHTKSMVIDDEYSVFGSMNLSRNGEIVNDENTLVIKNMAIAKTLKAQFLYIWSFLPEKYLSRIPRAEGFESIGSCSDGIDNDYDGDIDAKDTGCGAKSPLSAPQKTNR